MITLITMAMIYFSCAKSDLPPDDIADFPDDPLPEICLHDSIFTDTMYFDLGGDILTLPTVFTPEREGGRTHFYPDFDNEEIAISQYRVFTGENNWSDVKHMYGAQILVYTDEGVERAWDGEDHNNGTITRYHEGVFRFKFHASKPGAFLLCEGWACVDRSK